MDAFYVAVELLRRPELRGKPVIVAGSGPRAVVTTASYEARPYGVGSAIPVAHAKRRCRDLIHLPVDMAHYRERSREVMAIVAELGVPTQPVSLDETYIDLSSVPDPVARMSWAVRAIRERLELDASVGMGPNRLVAKVASDAEKPRGFVVLTPRAGGGALRLRAAAAAPGGRSEDRGAPGAARRADDRRSPGPPARRAGAPVRQQPRPRPARALALPRRLRRRPRARRSRARSRPPSTSTSPTLDELIEVLDRQSRRLAAELRERRLSGRTIGIKVRLDDWTTVTRVHTIEAPTNDAEVIAATARSLLRAYAPPRPVRLIGVRVAAFGERQRPTDAPPGELLSLLPAA